MSAFGTTDTRLGHADDLATLAQLDDEILLNHLHTRYDVDKIYVSANGTGQLSKICSLRNLFLLLTRRLVDGCGEAIQGLKRH